MIAYLPTLYEGELIYSWAARYALHSFAGYTHALESLLVAKTEKINVEFMGRWNTDAKTYLDKKYGMENIVLEHTLFKQYAWGHAYDKQQEALKTMLKYEHQNEIKHVLGMPNNSENKFFRYCPLCVKEDREKYGETYWHREHFLRGVNICPKHSCKLINTHVKYTSNQYRLFAAEELVDDALAVKAKKIDSELSEYITSVFEQPLLKENLIMVGQFLATKLEGTPYVSARGMQRHPEKLLEDMTNFYKYLEYNPIDKSYIYKRIFSGQKKGMLELCEVGLFLGVEPKEFLERKVNELSQCERFNNKVAQLRKEGKGIYKISKELNCSPSCALKANEKRSKKERSYSGRKEKDGKNWEYIDKELYEKIKEVILDIYTGNGRRPQKVTANKMLSLFGYSSKSSKKLPRCTELIKEYEETYEEYWTRECIWACKELERNNKAINFTNIQKLTNINKKNFESIKSKIPAI